MSFLRGEALWHLAWALPLLVLLWILKKKRERLVVPSTLLWQVALAEHRAHTPFRRLRRSLLLLLQACVLLLLVFALARPFRDGTRLEGMRLVVVIDASASMNARDVAGGRMAAAKRQVARWIDGLGPGARMMFIRAGARPTVLSSFQREGRRLHRALEGLEAGFGPGDLDGALRLAEEACAAPRPGDRIVVVSDGGGRAASTRPVAALPVEWILLGQGGENLAITSLQLRQNPFSAIDLQAYVRVVNLGREARSFDMRIEAEGSLSDLKRIRLDGGASRAVVFRRLAMESGSVRVSLDVDDDLPCDDEVWAVVEGRSRLAVHLRGPAAPFWEAALRDHGLVRLVKTPEEAALVVSDGSAPLSESLPCDRLRFTTAPVAFPSGMAGRLVEGPRIVDWDRGHPLLRFVELDELRLRQVRILPVPEGFRSLVRVEEGPIVVAGLDGRGHRSLTFGFDCLQGDLPLKAAFPVLVQNLVAWCLEARDESASHRAGEVVHLDVGGERELRLRTPRGKLRVLRPAGGGVDLGPFEELGIWRMSGKERQWRFAVNLFDEKESSLSGRRREREKREKGERKEGRTAPGRATVEKAAVSRRSLRRETWPWAVVLALVMLFLEWGLWRRRAHGL